MDENETVERLWELAEEAFENSRESLNEAIKADYRFTLDDLEKIVPEIAKKVFMMGFVTGLEIQLFSDDREEIQLKMSAMIGAATPLYEAKDNASKANSPTEGAAKPTDDTVIDAEFSEVDKKAA